MGTEGNLLRRFVSSVQYVLDTPVTFVREKIVKPNQQEYPWYHQKFRRVPSIDECEVEDTLCIYEADNQFRRDKMVDDEILCILRKRYEQCCWDYGEDRETSCAEIYNTYKTASDAWFIKYGEMGIYINSRNAYMKQKHRMIWERRHGPVGTGMKTPV